MQRGTTEELSEHICAIDFGSLDHATVAVIERLIADGIAVAIAGSKEASSRITAEYIRDLECGAQATVWGHDYQTSPAFAAGLNAVAMHALDFEPMASPPTHALSPVVPVALALAETRQADGKAIIAACAKGLEMEVRILAAAHHVSDALPFHTPGVVGALGSAVTASHLLRFDASDLANALGIAASRTGALRANVPSMVKDAHCGNAAASGLEAALLTQRGFTASHAILEAPQGYIATFFSQRFDRETLLAFGHPYLCVDPGMAIKFYPSEFPTHFGITAALELRRRLRQAQVIAHVQIIAPAMPDVDRPRPESGLKGKASLQYTVAAALLDGNVGIGSFTDERRFRPDMVDMLDKISVVCDKSIPATFRTMHVELVITLTDGTQLRGTCERPPGFWGAPVDGEQHRAKLRDCLSVGLDDRAVERTLELLDHLGQLAPQEVTALLALLACPVRAR